MQNNKKLMVILSPDAFDRATERNFINLFKEQPDYVWPPKFQRPDDPPNQEPTKDSVLVFEGGTDIPPNFYGETPNFRTQKSDTERDVWEYSYVEKALAVGAPMIGVCRGAQLLCALSGGHIIQHVTGHDSGCHCLTTFEKKLIWTPSVHHQLMNPYVLPRDEWVSLAHSNRQLSNKYRNGNNQKMRMRHLFSDWQEQEIVWFPKTKCLCIQGHPEYYEKESAQFVQFCRNMISTFILNN